MKQIRFSLRALLLTITTAAVLFGLYWLAWPRYQAYREQSQFEAVAKQFKAGVTPAEAKALLPNPRLWTCAFPFDAKRRHVGFSTYVYQGAVYFVYFHDCPPPGYVGDVFKPPCSGIEVYRLPPAPKGYQIQRRADDATKESLAARPNDAYANDFFLIVSGIAAAANENIKLEYELIHADPPNIVSSGHPQNSN